MHVPIYTHTHTYIVKILSLSSIESLVTSSEIHEYPNPQNMSDFGFCQPDRWKILSQCSFDVCLSGWVSFHWYKSHLHFPLCFLSIFFQLGCWCLSSFWEPYMLGRIALRDMSFKFIFPVLSCGFDFVFLTSFGCSVQANESSWLTWICTLFCLFIFAQEPGCCICHVLGASVWQQTQVASQIGTCYLCLALELFWCVEPAVLLTTCGTRTMIKR